MRSLNTRESLSIWTRTAMSSKFTVFDSLFEGTLNASGKRFAVVVARWNQTVTEQLLEGAVDAIICHGGLKSDITVVRVPGSFEIPLLCKKLAGTKKFDAIVTLGALIRGETDHYQLVAQAVAQGISQVMIETGVPITFGVITAHNIQQALERAGLKGENKGFEAALAGIETANVLLAIEERVACVSRE